MLTIASTTAILVVAFSGTGLILFLVIGTLVTVLSASIAKFLTPAKKSAKVN